VDITCKRGDTFNLNLELKDSGGNPLRLGEDQESIDPAVDPLSEKYYYTLEVREADTDDALASNPADNGYLLKIDGTVSTTSIGLFTSSATHEQMGAAVDSDSDLSPEVDTTGLSAGLYVYDIQQKIVDLGNDKEIGGAGLNADSISSIETLLYGTFKVVEDVTVNY
jgi:hypothetical protein